MKTQNLPMDKIMQLPDCCFGRRWFVGTYMGGTLGVVHYNMSEEQLPDKFVVWGVLFSCMSPNCLQAIRCTIRLGHVIPANIGAAQVLDRVFKDVSVNTIVYEFYINPNGVDFLPCQRQLIESQGRKLVIVTNGDQAIDYESTVAIQISALPKEVPDWLISGLDKRLS